MGYWIEKRHEQSGFGLYNYPTAYKTTQLLQMRHAQNYFVNIYSKWTQMYEKLKYIISWQACQ